MIDIAFIIGNLNKEHGGAQQLLFDICHNLPCDEFDTTVYYMFGKGTYQEKFEQQGVNVVNISASSNYDIPTFIRFVRTLSGQNHDILQTNSAISGLWGRTAGFLGQVPEIVSVEHSMHSAYPALHRIANGVTLPLADTIISVSNAVVDSFSFWEKTLIRDDTDTQVIKNGVDIEEIRKKLSQDHNITSELEISLEDPVIGTVGRFHDAKGYEYLIRSFPEIKAAYPTAQLLLLGDGEKRPTIEREAEKTGYSEDIYLPGFRSNVFSYLSIFDVAVFPSLWESFGLAPVEAMVAKRPIVGTNISAFKEVIGDAGILVEPKDESALATAVVSLLGNSLRKQELGERGYERAIEEFSIRRTVSEYAELYRELTTDK